MNTNDIEYNVNRRVERIHSRKQELFRVVLEPNEDDAPSILGTFEALAQELSYRVRPVMALSFVDAETLEPVALSKRDKELAAYKVVEFLVNENPELEQEYLDDKPAW